MKFQSNLLLVSIAGLVSAAPSVLRRDIDPSLVPQFGIQPGVNPDGTGNCDGTTNAAGKIVKIPCGCPPSEATFVASLNANAAAGHAVNNPSVAVSFPTGNDPNSLVLRLQASLVTLQNLNGPGQGCPGTSSTFSAQLLAAQQAASAAPPPAAAPPPPAAAPAPPAAAGNLAVDPALVPQFGITPGVNPTGTGNCQGTNNAQGVPIEIPCSCPPDRKAFINSLSANVAAGHAIHNPSVAVSFPTGNDKASEIVRIQAAIVTLQNLNGPGVGCPVASSTYVAQQKALS